MSIYDPDKCDVFDPVCSQLVTNTMNSRATVENDEEIA